MATEWGNDERLFRDDGGAVRRHGRRFSLDLEATEELRRSARKAKGGRE